MHDDGLLFKYWGKARPQMDGPSWHPLVYHNLDVAASGKVFLQLHGQSTHRVLHGCGDASVNAIASFIVRRMRQI